MLLRLKSRSEKTETSFLLEFVDGSNETYYLEIKRNEMVFKQFDLIHIDDIERMYKMKNIL